MIYKIIRIRANVQSQHTITICATLTRTRAKENKPEYYSVTQPPSLPKQKQQQRAHKSHTKNKRVNENENVIIRTLKSEIMKCLFGENIFFK